MRSNDDARLNEKLNEAILFSAGLEHSKNILDDADRLLEEYKEIEAPESLNIWFSDLIRKSKRYEKRKKLRIDLSKIGRRAAIIIAALFVTFAIAMVTVEAFRVKVFNMVIEVEDRFSTVRFKEANKIFSKDGLPANWSGYYPTILPEGYEFKNAKDKKSVKVLVFSRNEKEIIFLQTIASADFQIDTENAEMKESSIHGGDALIVTKEDRCIITWQEGDYVFQLVGTVDESSLMEVAESVRGD